MKQLELFLTKHHTDHEFSCKLSNHCNNIFTNHGDFEHFNHFTIFAGLLPTSWKLQAIPTSTTNTPLTTLQQIWATKFSVWMTNQGFELWNTRNSRIHKNNNVDSSMDRALNQKIKTLYDLKDSIGYHDRDIFSKPLKDRLSLTTKQKMNWIETTTKTLKRCIQDHEDKQITGQRDIRQFFAATTSTRKT